MRYSYQRELIENLVKGSLEHPTAEIIYAWAKKLAPKISLGTVYRNLKILADEGVIDTLETVDDKIHYDGNTDGHIHFVCSKCGKIVDFFEKASVPSALTDKGFIVENAKCVYYGICSDCNKKSK